MARAYDFRRVERRWQAAWEEACCFRAPEPPGAQKFYNYDSGPFPNGPLHIGHVRTYVLGDLTARYQRSRGRAVLYATELDAFGLPNEMAALKEGLSPARFTHRWIQTMIGQLRGMGISYDWSRVVNTSEPDYYRWTQALFLDLLEAGLLERRETEVAWCDGCETALARMQADHGRCWRCSRKVGNKTLPQWFVKLSDFSRHLRRGLDDLDGWSLAIRKLLIGFIGRDSTGTGEEMQVSDWMISRQRSWGTPTPIVHCPRCGAVPVPREDLPVLLPLELDWSLGSGALRSCDAFVQVRCPSCGEAAERETDTLDCFFDDIWCFMAPPATHENKTRNPFRAAALNSWLPVDRFHGGQDAFLYLHLHRFLGELLHRKKLLADPEPIRGHVGYAMVLANGRKMSTHLGNAVSAGKLLRKYGADTLRLAVLWAGNPQRTLEWRPEHLTRAESFLADMRLFTRCTLPRLAEQEDRPATGEEPSGSRATITLQGFAGRSWERIGRFIDEDRPNAAIQELFDCFRRIQRYTAVRVDGRPLAGADRRILMEVLGGFAVTLSPFTPHLAEEFWEALGSAAFVCQAPWPPPGR